MEYKIHDGSDHFSITSEDNISFILSMQNHKGNFYKDLEFNPSFISDKEYVDALKNKENEKILNCFSFLETEEYTDIRNVLIYRDKVKNISMRHQIANSFENSMDHFNDILLYLMNDSKILHIYEKNRIREFYKNDCKEIKLKKERIGHVYLIESCGLYKIGRSKDAEDRKFRLETIMPIEIKFTLIHYFKTYDYVKAERILHEKYSYLRKRGEWFSLSDKEINEICSIKNYQL